MKRRAVNQPEEKGDRRGGGGAGSSAAVIMRFVEQGCVGGTRRKRRHNTCTAFPGLGKGCACIAGMIDTNPEVSGEL